MLDKISRIVAIRCLLSVHEVWIIILLYMIIANLHYYFHQTFQMQSIGKITFEYHSNLLLTNFEWITNIYYSFFTPPAGCRSDSDCSGQNECVNRKCVPVCVSDGRSCGHDAICYGIKHRAICECPPGLTGNPSTSCTVVACKADSECPVDKSCINHQCINPCTQKDDCIPPAVCISYNHKATCSCPPGYVPGVNGCEKSMCITK